MNELGDSNQSKFRRSAVLAIGFVAATFQGLSIFIAQEMAFALSRDILEEAHRHSWRLAVFPRMVFDFEFAYYGWVSIGFSVVLLFLWLLLLTRRVTFAEYVLSQLMVFFGYLLLSMMLLISILSTSTAI